MTFTVAVVGAGPAGFAVTAALLDDSSLDAQVVLVDRAEVPDGMLRHGPAAGEDRLREVAAGVDAVLGDDRVTYLGGIAVGSTLPIDALRSAADAVVLATGAPLDLPFDIAGRDSVGVGTLSHVKAWLCGSADTDVAELDLDMDTAVIAGISAEAVTAAGVLCGEIPADAVAEARDRLAHSKVRHVQIVDPRPASAVELPESLPANLVVRTDLTPVGVVGRNRARALRCLHRPDSFGRVVSEDLRAQLLLRPRAQAFPWSGLDQEGGHIAHRDGRVLAAGQLVAGLYVAGWAARDPDDEGAHPEDAALVVSAIRQDRSALPTARRDLSELTAELEIEVSRIDGWSAVEATVSLLDRFAGEGKSPLADYDALMDQVDED